MLHAVSAMLQWAYLGRQNYDFALALQERLRDEVRAERRPDTLALLEHPPVITLGRSAEPGDVLVSEAELRRRGVACVRIGRGGLVTYHGPGQLVGYPIRRVGRAIRGHVRGMADALLGYLGDLGIAARWSDDCPGIWTDGGKIAAVGVDARGGVTMHGFALNVAPRLEDFSLIVPCGSRQPVTSIAALLGCDRAMPEVAAELAVRLAEAYGATPLAVMAAELATEGGGPEGACG